MTPPKPLWRKREVCSCGGITTYQATVADFTVQVVVSDGQTRVNILRFGHATVKPIHTLTFLPESVSELEILAKRLPAILREVASRLREDGLEGLQR